MFKVKWGILAFFGMVSYPTLFCVAGCGGAQSSQVGAPGVTDSDAALSDATNPPANTSADDSGTPSNGILQSLPADGCTPLTGCPPGIQCGRYTDPCSGNVLVCGTACPNGKVCSRSASDPSAQSCQPKACTGKCGIVGLDACGVPIACGGCAAGMDCIGNQCVAASTVNPSDGGACATLTCTPDPQTHLCGNVTDGCGHTMDCSCAAGTVCTGGACTAPAPECSMADGGSVCGTVQNACGSGSIHCGNCPGGQCVQGMCIGCTPPSCGNAHCGKASNACGQSISCGMCAAGSECVKGVCTACAPPTCGTATCGKASNACGQSTSCGSCSMGECYSGQCCTPLTCANANDGGPATSCDPVSLGCGITKSCAPCGAGEACSNHKCIACVPKTCADFAAPSFGHGDGCGKMLDCCPQGTACKGEGLCCTSQEVAYNGSCCLPSCDPAQPSGAQLSCGQTIFCAPGQKGPPR